MTVNTYTSELGASEDRMKSLTSAVSSGISGLPGINDALRKSVFEREKTLGGLEKDNESKIKELYTADQRYAERYSDPEGGMYIENPYKRQGAISGQKADIRGELGNILSMIQQRQQTMGNAIDKGMELYKMGLEAQKFELEQTEKEWERIWKKKKDAQSGQGTDYSAQFGLLKNLWGSGESQPLQTPASGKGTKSSGGDWEYTGGGDMGWENTNNKQRILAAAESNPKIAALALSNMGLFEEEENEYEDTDAHIQSIEGKGRVLKNFPLSTQDEIIARIYSQGWQINQSGDTITKPGASTQPTVEEDTGGSFIDKLKRIVSGDSGPTVDQPEVQNMSTPGSGSVTVDPEDIALAQAKIDEHSNPLDRATIYKQLIDSYPQLVGSIFY